MINNITFTGRETMLIDAAKYAAETTARKAAQKVENTEVKVIKASTQLMEIPFLKSYPFTPDDKIISAGAILNHII